MIVEINTPAGIKTMLLGYEALKHMAAMQKSNDKTEIELVEEVALKAFNVFSKRKGLDAVTVEDLYEWFDDFEVFVKVQESITDFCENFTKKVSLNPGTPKAAKAKK